MSEFDPGLELKLEELESRVKEFIDHELEKIRGDLDRMDDLFSIQLDQDSKISQLESRINQLEATLNQLKQLVESLNERFNNLVKRFNLHLAEHAKRGEK